MDIASELAAAKPADYVVIRWFGDEVESIAVIPGWASVVPLPAILNQVVAEIASRRRPLALDPVRLRVSARGFRVTDIAQLGEILGRYNEQRRAARRAETPQHRVTRTENVELLWYGDQLTGINVAAEWVANTTSQRLSEVLTEALSGLGPLPGGSEADVPAHAELLRFLG